MFEYYNNVLCVYGRWLADQGIMSDGYQRQLKRTKKITVARHGCRNTPKLIVFDSLAPNFRDQVVEITGDPYLTTKNHKFTDFIESDLEAVEFFNTYTRDNGKELPDTAKRDYICTANIFNAIKIVFEDRSSAKKAFGKKTGTIFKSIAKVIHELPKNNYPHSLPKNYRTLKIRYDKFIENGYEGIISNKWGNKNSEKINDSAKVWLISRMANQVEKVANMAQLLYEYNLKADKNEWLKIIETDTIYNFLHKPEIKYLWYGHRYGELKAKEKYTYQNKTSMPSMRDSLWYSDGTKLNLWYKDANGKPATCQVYEVMDAYSDVFLGYHVSPTENFKAQFSAYRMAVKVSQARPHQTSFDNQGGHGKLEAGNFLNKISKIASKTKPYNGKSKTIENAFKRFQMEVMKKLWYFTGQNIQAKSPESKANLEFVQANLKNLLPLSEVIAQYEALRNQWNARLHHATKIPRIEMYRSSLNPEVPKLSYWEQIDIFWIEKPKPVQFTAYGMNFELDKVKYSYSVLNADGMPDIEFLRSNIDKKFIVKYDPEDMTLIYLYEKTASGLVRVAAAETTVVTHRNIQEQEEWEAEWLQRVNEMNEKSRVDVRDRMQQILEDHEATPEHYGLNSPKIKGIETRKKKKKEPKVADFNKTLSNQVPALSDGDDEGSPWDLI